MRTMGFWSRSLGGALGLWFGLVMAAPAILHACPQALAAAAASDSHTEHGTHHSGNRDDGAPAQCRCLGTCAVSAAPALLSVPAVPVAILTPAPRASILSTAGPVFHATPDHTRPFATAPPLRTA